MEPVKTRSLVACAALLAATAFGAWTAASAVAAAPTPFGHDCQAQDGVRFCPTASLDQRVPTFDGVPLDTDVTLPPKGQGPFPTIVMLHGWGGNKADFESTSPSGGSPVIYHYNNVFYARHGYAVVNYTARGFGDSCGAGDDHTGACGSGYIRLADTRYEARDTQYLLGKLVDEGISDPRALGVTGISYGGGQSMELAFLNDRIRKPDGDLVPWRSPKGAHLHIAAAYPRWPWSDLVDALIPNGRFLDAQIASHNQSMHPIGVPIQSYITGLYALGQTTGYYCGTAPASMPCTDRDANLPQSFAEVQAGQPLNPDALAAIQEVYDDHGAYALRFVSGHSRPAPLLIQNGFTDDLFPPSQALRAYNYLRTRYRHFPVSLQFGDLGHSRGSNKTGLNHYFNDQAARFFAADLRGQGHGPSPGSVSAFTQTCPLSKPDGGPFEAHSWRAIQGRAVEFGSAAPQTFTSAGGDASVAQAYDPIFGTSSACQEIDAQTESNTANYDHRFRRGMTMMGLPKVRAAAAATGEFGQIDARLWDVSPQGKQLLISRGVYSLKSDQSVGIHFQLHGNGWRFDAGHTAELELLGRDAPYYQAGNSPFSVTVSKLTVSLPQLTR